MITAGLATIKIREQNLKATLSSLLPQADLIHVYLDDYTEVPEWLNQPKINPILEDKRRGDAGKFYYLNNAKGYYLSCDDDLLYPSDYVEKLIESIEKYGRQCVISYHGRQLLDTPIRSYYVDLAYKWSCLNTVERDQYCHIAGTGTMGFHTDTIHAQIDDFPIPNMADIWMGLICQKQRVPQIVAAHEARWITHQEIPGSTIYKDYRRNHKPQTKTINDYHDWRLYVLPNAVIENNYYYAS